MKSYFIIIFLIFLQKAQAHLFVDLREVQDEKNQIWQLVKNKFVKENTRLRLSSFTKAKTGEIKFSGFAHVMDLERGGVFQTFRGQLNSQGQLSDFQIDKIIPLSTMNFVVRAYVKPLVTEIESPEHGIRILIPFGGPGIDHGVTPRARNGSVFMTPFFQGYLTKKTTVKKRCDPAHYKCKPFIRLIPEGTDHSLYGYHTEPFQDVFERGFVSAGCFRLKDSDLWELYQVIRFGALNRIPFEMIEDDAKLVNAHPYPKVEDSYEGIVRWRLKEGRIVFNSKRIKQSPPLVSVRFQTLQEVKRIDQETRLRLGRNDTSHFLSPRF